MRSKAESWSRVSWPLRYAATGSVDVNRVCCGTPSGAALPGTGAGVLPSPNSPSSCALVVSRTTALTAAWAVASASSASLAAALAASAFTSASTCSAFAASRVAAESAATLASSAAFADIASSAFAAASAVAMACVANRSDSDDTPVWRRIAAVKASSGTTSSAPVGMSSGPPISAPVGSLMNGVTAGDSVRITCNPLASSKTIADSGVA